jgi:acyl-CoA synthetase (AMP-forming)/AMP-acid ligase II
MNAAHSLLHAWRVHGERPAILGDAGAVWSFAALHERAQAWAEGFSRAGRRPGDRIAAALEPSAEGIAAMLGALAAGAAWVPVNTRYRADERAHVVGDSGARLLLRSGDEPIESTVPVAGIEAGPSAVHALAEANDPAAPHAAGSLLVYTSGTTGRSKGVELPPEAIEGGIGALVDAWRFGPADVLSLALPIYHVHGLCIGVFGALLRGVTMRLHAHFDAARVVEDFRAAAAATVFMGVPTMYVALLDHLEAHPEAGEVLAHARLFTAGSAALRPDVLERFEQATGHRILERYGMTETLISLCNPYDGPRRAGAVGRPVPGYAIRIVREDGRDAPSGEAGELFVRGPGTMRGYWAQPEATAAAFEGGWFRTGDVAVEDEDGFVRIVGRMSVDIIKSGGFKIAAGEIEDVLRSHPAVKDAAVLGVPDPRWGEAIAAAVELRAGAALPDPAGTLAAWVAERLADYKKPRRVKVIDALPRNALGKVVKPELRRAFEA